MVSVLVNNWWAFALRGLVAILFGITVFAFPGPTMLSLVLLFAVYAFIEGVLAIVSAVRAAREGERWGLLVVEGIVSILASIAAVAMPGLTVVLFVTLVAAWAIITGCLVLAAAFKVDSDHGRWWLVLGGIVSVLYGVAVIAAPMAGALVLVWWIGAYAVVFGIALMVFGFGLRNWSHRGPLGSPA